MTPRILIIAGSDSGGGAGIQADIKTVTMLGGHAMTAVTAITAQNTLGVQAVHPVPTDIVVQQMRSCIDDLGVDAVKIGMIGSAETAHAVADVLEPLGRVGMPIVFDPVMIATSGSVLADPATIEAFGRLMRVAMLITPNAPELAVLTGRPVETEREALLAGHDLTQSTGAAVLAKGGHLLPEATGQVLLPQGEAGDLLADNLVLPDGTDMVWTDPRIDSPHTHGTGCTLASAVAEGLGRDLPLPDAIARARRFVRIALREAPGLGAGHGPMGHQRVRLDCDLGGAMINQVTLPATDHVASVAFYNALGLTMIVESAGRYARFESAGGTTLSVEAAAEIRGQPIIFLEVTDLDAAVASARAHGIAVADPQLQPWGWHEARLTDPAGNTLCLYVAGENRRFPPWRIS
ncbi:bifunctional hydroxymethylpyrimidine kinase/phosphomethylpyrimidine kinase [Sphingomonas mucosissima]|uniref:hydroxymethylpyrimidine kinase n=1 Tax=Sphingomonas mucosissima TaxID=370959 RepID=A0A245ZIX0_9SPHN|nr:bifunctional hydroxymethylpyrimidine kinase/phosphomethylpyrimidine kinase [Sphingomonas mucosissima]OWK29686.1 hydroxymethylpyrimidine/phosphomethylpyrimidine kinase [Sphingomonas mucosissima]